MGECPCPFYGGWVAGRLEGTCKQEAPSFFFTGQAVVFLVAGAWGAPLPRLPGRILGGVIGRLEGRRGPGELHAKVVVGGLTLVVEIRI